MQRNVMDGEELRRISRAFWHRHRRVWRFIHSHEPGFWDNLWDTMEVARRWRWTEEGAVVAEPPTTRDAEAQTPARETRDAAVETTRGPTCEVGTQADAQEGARQPAPVQEDWLPPPPPTKTVREDLARRYGAPPAENLRHPGGCWNCLSELHAYPECDLPRMQSFCFGCGERDVTVRTCPRCGPTYRRTEPYTGPRGPRERRRRGDRGRRTRQTSTSSEGWPWRSQSESSSQ